MAGFVLLATAAAWGYWTYRQYRSYQTPIPKAATSIIRVSVDALAMDLAWNTLWNGRYYREKQRDGATGFDREVFAQTGMAIPANIFLYQLDSSDDISPYLYFGSVPLTDTSVFSNWLNGLAQIHVNQDGLGKFAYSEHLLIVHDADHAFFAISPKPFASTLPTVRKRAYALMTSDEWVSVGKSPLHGIRKLPGHVAAIGEMQTSIQFKSGEARFSVKYAPDTLPAPAGDMPEFPSSNTASLWIANASWLFPKDRPLKAGPYIWQRDDLQKYGKGELLMEWKGTVLQQDTVVDYDYDEDFNMSERQEIIEKPVPDLSLSIAADSSLDNYLQNQGILDTPGHSISREVLPLYRVHVSPVSEGYMQFHTANRHTELPKRLPADGNIFYLRINFGNMDLSSVAPFIGSYAALADYMEASGRVTKDNKVSIHGKLRMHDTRINSLIQLVTHFDVAQ